MTIVLSLLIGSLASLAAYIAAQRKGRRAKAWMTCCFFISPLLLILEFLPITSRNHPQKPLTRLRLYFFLEWAGVSVVALCLLCALISFVDPSLLD